MTWLTDRRRNGGIDEVPLPGGVAGRLWLCGKHYIGPDPDAALEHTGAAVVVCLNEGYELFDRYPSYVEWLRKHAGTRALWSPWPDMHAPPLEDFAAFIADLGQRLADGDGVVIHCGAGMGRAGTTAAALLMANGMPLSEALRAVRAARPAAGPQTGEQDALLAAYTELLDR